MSTSFFTCARMRGVYGCTDPKQTISPLPAREREPRSEFLDQEGKIDRQEHALRDADVAHLANQVRKRVRRAHAAGAEDVLRHVPLDRVEIVRRVVLVHVDVEVDRLVAAQVDLDVRRLAREVDGRGFFT